MDNKLSWPAVRPVLIALRDYWEAGGFSPNGIQLPAVVNVFDEHEGLFIATVRALVAGDYLRAAGDVLVLHTPAEVHLTDRARSAIDGWPGAAPEELVESLLSVLLTSAATEPDPAKKRRFERVAETIKELGVSTASEVIAKVLVGV